MSLKRKRDVWAEVETGLGSSGRIKILRYLIQHSSRQYTKYSLRMPTGLKTEEISRQIQTLVDLGWVKEFPIEPKTYGINIEDDVVKVISDFFQQLKLL